MIDLYTWTTPNGRKPAIMLEECGLEYSVHPINIRNGDQFKPEFVKICPNSKIPAIVDHDAGVSIFESGAILVHLAEKTGKFLGERKCSNGFSGRWQMSVRCSDRRAISSTRRLKKFHTRSIATPPNPL